MFSSKRILHDKGEPEDWADAPWAGVRKEVQSAGESIETGVGN